MFIIIFAFVCIKIQIANYRKILMAFKNKNISNNSNP